MGKFRINYLIAIFLVGLASTVSSDRPTTSGIQFSWKCENQTCVKEVVQKESTANVKEITPFCVCRLLCGPSILWPQPVTYNWSGPAVQIKSIVINYNPKNILLPRKLQHLLEGAEIVFRDRIASETNQIPGSPKPRAGTHELQVKIKITDILHHSLTLSTDESYTLTVKEGDNEMIALLDGETFFGVRHGLETLAQLIVYDNVHNQLVIPKSVNVIDNPQYPYRGVMLDTSRNYFSVDSIKRTINAMAANKLNTFHWHITDSQSFPLKLNNFQQFAEYGAYSELKVYTEDDIKEIVNYASFRGVRIVPELDAPAHTGEGWQWAPSGTILCLNQEPWQSYCMEPPCGQLNPLSEHTYSILGELYVDYNRLFKSDIFHMGGDEVHFGCWDTSEDIRSWINTNFPNNVTSDANKSFIMNARSQSHETSGKPKKAYYELWNKFQQQAREKLKEAHKDKKIQPEVVLWSSDLTKGENLNTYFNQSDYIIQVWTRKNDYMINELLDENIRIILSNFDGLYLDSGFGSWVSDHSDSIYRPWYSIYDNVPAIFEQLPEAKKQLILGQEAALWSEMAAEESLDSRLWPRVAALAERTWTNPKTNWRQAESRMLYHRERLVKFGIQADAIQPEWCNINKGGCSNT